jgi:hypothetical protein
MAGLCELICRVVMDCDGDDFCRCRSCKPSLAMPLSRPAPLPFGSSLVAQSRRIRAAVAIAGARQ